MVFGGHIGNPAQLRWIGDAAPHAWNNGVGAVLLDIGIDAFIDQARLRIVARFAWPCGHQVIVKRGARSEEHTSELQSLMRISYAVFCLKKKKYKHKQERSTTHTNQT